MLDSGRPPAQPQTLLPKESLEEMGNELVSLCDGLEKHGLVDYQMGVSEQEIIESKPKSIRIFATDVRIIFLTARQFCLDALILLAAMTRMTKKRKWIQLSAKLNPAPADDEDLLDLVR